MKVTIVGGWSNRLEENKAWNLKITDPSSLNVFKEACWLIGEKLAQRRHTVIVGSDSHNSADYHVVQGFLSQYTDQKASEPLIHLIQGIQGEGDLYPKERTSDEHQRLFTGTTYSFFGEKPRAAEKIQAVKEADALIAIGGLTDTYVAGIGALMARKLVVPVASFGGAALQLWHAMRPLDYVKEDPNFNQLTDENWNPDLANTAFRFGGLDRPRIFFGYSTKAEEIASEIHEYVESLGFEVIDWKTNFTPSQVILDELHAKSYLCNYAIFLLTPDDLIEGKIQRWVPRDNVIFEVGYFLNALGKEKTGVIVQKDVSVLADYGGHIYIDLPKNTDDSKFKTKLKEFLGIQDEASA